MVTNVLGHARIANKGVDMNFANIHVVDCLFVRTVVKPYAASLALRVTESVTDAALTENVRNVVPRCVSRAENHVLGVVLTTSAIICVGRNATDPDVMLPARGSCLAAIRVLVCVEKTVLLCVPFVILRSFLPC